MPPGMCLCRIVSTAAPEVASRADDCCEHCDRSHTPLADHDPCDDGDPTRLPPAPDGPCAFTAADASRPPTPEPVTVRRDLAAADAVSIAVPNAPRACLNPDASGLEPRLLAPPAFISHCALLL
jgi:hypothetical protein